MVKCLVFFCFPPPGPLQRGKFSGASLQRRKCIWSFPPERERINFSTYFLQKGKCLFFNFLSLKRERLIWSSFPEADRLFWPPYQSGKL